MTIRRTVTLIVSAAALLAAACSSPTGPSAKACDVVTMGSSTC